MESSFFFGRQFGLLKRSYFKQNHFIAWFLIHTKSVRVLCWYQKFVEKKNPALAESDTTFKFIIYPAVACVRACVHIQWGEQMGADLSLWVPPPRHHGAPPFQWKQVGSPHSANHAASRCGRRVRGREAGPTQLILPRIHRRKKSGKHVCRPVAQFLLAHMRVFGGSGRH